MSDDVDRASFLPQKSNSGTDLGTRASKASTGVAVHRPCVGRRMHMAHSRTSLVLMQARHHLLAETLRRKMGESQHDVNCGN